MTTRKLPEIPWGKHITQADHPDDLTFKNPRILTAQKFLSDEVSVLKVAQK